MPSSSHAWLLFSEGLSFLLLDYVGLYQLKAPLWLWKHNPSSESLGKEGGYPLLTTVELFLFSCFTRRSARLMHELALANQTRKPGKQPGREQQQIPGLASLFIKAEQTFANSQPKAGWASESNWWLRKKETMEAWALGGALWPVGHQDFQCTLPFPHSGTLWPLLCDCTEPWVYWPLNHLLICSSLHQKMRVFFMGIQWSSRPSLERLANNVNNERKIQGPHQNAWFPQEAFILGLEEAVRKQSILIKISPSRNSTDGTQAGNSLWWQHGETKMRVESRARLWNQGSLSHWHWATVTWCITLYLGMVFRSSLTGTSVPTTPRRMPFDLCRKQTLSRIQ